MSGSVSFDRAVAYYDRTRGISPEAMATLVDQLAAQLRGKGPCVDVGAGTGIVSVPLARAGVRVVGVDLSAPMLGELVRKAGSLVPVVRADATRLPFRNHTFAGATIRHVLHLIRAWRDVIADLARVIEPGGVVLVSSGGVSPAWEELSEIFSQRIGRPRARAGWTGDRRVLDHAFAAIGAVGRDLPPIDERTSQSLGDFIAQMADGLHSWTWDVDETARREAAEHVRAWTLERYGSLDPPDARSWSMQWRAYDLP